VPEIYEDCVENQAKKLFPGHVRYETAGENMHPRIGSKT
jgi:hypothetical protein